MNPFRCSKIYRMICAGALGGMVFSLAQAGAQPALGPASPAIPTIPATPTLAPPAPAIPASLRPAATNAPLGSSMASLIQALGGLQVQLQQALPVLQAFNNSFDFVTIGSLTTTNTRPGTGANFSSNLGANFASSSSQNLSASAAVPTINPASAAAANAFGLPPELQASPITADTLRSLLVLQNDLERMLPTLSALNGGTNFPVGLGLTPGFAPGSVSSAFTTPSTIR